MIRALLHAATATATATATVVAWLATPDAACALDVPSAFDRPAGNTPDADDRAALRAWLERQLMFAPESLNGRVFDIRTTTFPMMTDDAFEALRQRVDGKPDHPERLWFIREAKLRAAPQEQHTMVWLAPTGALRVSECDGDRGEDANITTVTCLPGVAWMSFTAGASAETGGARGGQLTVLDPRENNPPTYQFASFYRNKHVDALAYAATGGMSMWHRVAPEATVDVTLNAEQWKAHIRGKDWAWDVAGTWKQPANPQIEGVTVVKTPAAALLGTRDVFSGWVDLPGAGWRMAQRVEQFRPDGKMDSVRTFAPQPSFPSEADWAAMTATPAPGSIDPLTGQRVPLQVVDFRGSATLKSRHTPGLKPAETDLGPSPAGSR